MFDTLPVKLNKGKSMSAHVSMAFAKYADRLLAPFATGVRDGIGGNATLFPNPPVDLGDLDTAISAYQAALGQLEMGGMAETQAKKTRRAELIMILRQLAVFVERVANGDEMTILASGFTVARRGHSPQRPLGRPGIRRVLNWASKQLLVRATRVPNARSYEAQVRVGGGPWQPAGVSTRAGRIILENLTPGVLYEIRVRAIGGSTGYSDWSDAVSHMCM